jgi:general secretion pathway protein E
VFFVDAPTFADRVVELVQAAFGFGTWAWVGRATLVALFIATALEVAGLLVGRPPMTERAAFSHLDPGSVRERIREVARRVDDCLERPTGDVVQALDELIRGAVTISASDIHMSPTPQGYRLTYRVHGTLYEAKTVSLDHAPKLSTRVKVLARLDTYVRGKPQDGRLVVHIDGVMIEARVSTLPTESGERIVLRFVSGSRSVPDLEALGFSEEVLARLKELLSKPQGLFLMTAPVGSGKTTTLYAALKHIASARGATTSLVTLEDPIEIELPFATQTQMHDRSGMTFASTLRSVLRQDPNVLMLGEIRDQETAAIAVQAGLTGHLILTTVHGDSAAGAFARLADMDVEPFVLASASLGCLSQRLVRTLCTACRRSSAPEPLIVSRFAQLGMTLPSVTFFEPKGCDYCEGTGFTGRQPISELLVVDGALRAAINDSRPTGELAAMALQKGMTPLLADGLACAVRGETSLAEVLRVAG